MSERMQRRLSALEAKAISPSHNNTVLFMPAGLSASEQAEWHRQNVGPIEAAGIQALVVRFVRVGDV